MARYARDLPTNLRDNFTESMKLLRDTAGLLVSVHATQVTEA